MALTSTVSNLHLKILYSISSSDNSNPNYILARHRPTSVSVFSEDVGGQGEMKYAMAPLRACLDAISISSPELLSDPNRDYSMYAQDPLEALPAQLTSETSLASSFNNRVFVGMGLMRQFLNEGQHMTSQSTNGDVSVTGRVILDRSIRAEVVEVILSLRENRTVPTPATRLALPQYQPQVVAHLNQPSQYVSLFGQTSGTSVMQYGSSPAVPIVCGDTTRRRDFDQPKRKPTRRTPTPLNAGTDRSSKERTQGTLAKPIVIDEETPIGGGSQLSEETLLTQMAQLVAQVDDPIQQRALVALLAKNAQLANPLVKSENSSQAEASTSTPSGSTQPLPLKRHPTAPEPSSRATTSKKKAKTPAPVPPPFENKAERCFPLVNRLSDIAFPSSDAGVAPSSPTPAIKVLKEIRDLKDVNYYPSKEQEETAAVATGAGKYYRKRDARGSLLSHPPLESQAAGGFDTSKRPGLALPGSAPAQPKRDVSAHHSRTRSSDENVNPSPPDPKTLEKRRKRSDSHSGDDQPSFKKGRCALGVKNGDATLELPTIPRARTPPALQQDSAFSPNKVMSILQTPTKRRDSPFKLFTPSPIKSPSKMSIANLVTPRPYSQFPSTGLTPSSPGMMRGMYSPNFKDSFRSFQPMTPSSSSGLARTFPLFEDSGVGLGGASLGWTDFALSDQVALAVDGSSDPTEVADAASSIAALNSERWLDLPPSSPPPLSSPLKGLSDSGYSFDLDEFYSELSESHESTPASEDTAGMSERGESPMHIETPDSGADLEVAAGEGESDINAAPAVDPYELFKSLGLTFPLEIRGSSDPILLTDTQEGGIGSTSGDSRIMGSDDLLTAEGVKQLIGGCLL